MSDTHLLLARAATSLTLMLKGLDSRLDLRLHTLRGLLRQKDFQLEQFQAEMAEVESVYDLLEQSTEQNIQLYLRSFKSLLADSSPAILASLQRLQPVLSDLLSFAEPLAHFVTAQLALPAPSIGPDGQSRTANELSGAQLDVLRHRLAGRFKALLQSLVAIGPDPVAPAALMSEVDRVVDWQALDRLAHKTLDLLQVQLREEKLAFVDYLTELDTRLARINQIVTADSRILGELRAINGLFNRRMNQQVTEVRAQIDNSPRVEVLKNELLGSLDQITHRLVEYQDGYTSRLDQLQTNTAQMAGAIRALEQDNQELHSKLKRELDLSILDTLTQLPNRLGFNNQLEAELSRATRYHHPLSIAIIDIDFFKRINDEFGHLVGDKVLRVIALEMKRICREHDYIARYGGEEFILLLPQTLLPDAHSAVEKIRYRVAHCRFHFHNKPVPLTISAGVAQWRPGEATDAWIERADRALYAGKQNGRNRVIAEAD